MRTKFEYEGLGVDRLQRVNMFCSRHVNHLEEMLVLSTDESRSHDSVLNFPNRVGRVTKKVESIHMQYIESLVHYTDFRKVIEKIERLSEIRGLQILITTQSLELIGVAHTYFMEQASYDFAYHRIDWSEQDHCYSHVCYDQETLEGAVRLNFEVR